MNKSVEIDKMRDLYRAGDVDGLKRRFLLASWFLTDEEKQRIQQAIDKLTYEDQSLHPLVRYACKVLGGKVVKQ